MEVVYSGAIIFVILCLLAYIYAVMFYFEFLMHSFNNVELLLVSCQQQPKIHGFVVLFAKQLKKHCVFFQRDINDK